MRSVSKTVSAVGSSAAIPMDTYISPFNVGFGVVITGTPTYTVQHTFDNVLDDSVTPVWFSHPTVVDKLVSADGNYAFPVAAIKLVMTAGTGTAKLTVIQAGLVGA